MPLQLEFKQMPQAFTMTRLHAGACRRKEVVVTHGTLGFSEFEEDLLILHFFVGGVVEQRVAVIEQRSWTSQSICPGIYEETKISKVSVGIGDDGIEDEHIFQRIHVLRPKRFVILDDSLHPTALHDISNRNEGQFFTGDTLGVPLNKFFLCTILSQDHPQSGWLEWPCKGLLLTRALRRRLELIKSAPFLISRVQAPMSFDA